jgi:PAS domain S-box-containing protein
MNDSAEHAAPGLDLGPHGEARDLWRAVNELISDILLQVRPDGTIFFLNRPPNGIPATALLGRSILDFVVPSMRAEVAECLRSVAPGEPTRRRLIQAELPDGTRRWYATSTVPVARDGRVVAITVSARDLSLQKPLGDAPVGYAESDTATRLRHVQRLELVGLLAGGLVHNFNNVLTVIGSATDLLLRAVRDGDALRPDLESIQRAVAHGSGLTQHLLDLSKRQGAARSRVELNSVVHDVVTMARLFLAENVRLVTQLEAAGAPVTGNRSEMEQVLLNLLLNARDAMPHGGSIVISTTRLNYTAATSPHGCSLRGAVVRLRVEDTGRGIDDATRARIFEPFFTTKAPHCGTGLGLPTVQAIVKESGGCVDLVSRPGNGTTVDVVMPDADCAGLRAA